jgi:hypothetical protein
VFRPEVSSRGDYVWPHDDLKDEDFQALKNTREESISITNHRFGAPIKE